MTEPGHAPWRRSGVVCGVIFGAIWLLHLPFLRLPYYWDEAGYFVPAAHDIYASGSFIPYSTLSNAHPPLVMTFLALAWKLAGFHHVVTRTAMLLVSAVALAGAFRVGERVVNTAVAVAAVPCIALYPVFFAQSSLAHLDMMVTALTMWALVFYLPSTVPAPPGTTRRRRLICIVLLSLAALTKETAVLIPITLFGWESLGGLIRRIPRLSRYTLAPPTGGLEGSFGLLLALLPLAAWFAYHRAFTGYTFGNPEYVRYNVGATLNAARVYGAFTRRVAQVTQHMNLWALTLVGLLALACHPWRPRDTAAAGIDGPAAALFIVLIVAHVAALSLVGGAVLARYLLPVFPLLVLLWVSVIWQCARWRWLGIAFVCGAFAYRCNVNPRGNFTWEDNLAYRDFICLHMDAASYIGANQPRAKVLTAWPATNELTSPMLGYVSRPVRVYPVEDLKRATLQEALLHRSAFDAALLYSTPYGIKFDELRTVFGGQVIFSEVRKGQWVALIVGIGPLK